jgi:translation initiation factor 4B
MDKLPSKPPYTAFIGNLPYDVNEEDIEFFFKNISVSGQRLMHL